MFYLINDKDGLFKESILVNAMNLKSLEVTTATDDDDFDVKFTHKGQEDETVFGYNDNEIFNVDSVISKIASMKKWQFDNPFIILTDIENVNTIIENFGSNSKLLSKMTTILINIHDIGLVYEDEDEFILTTAHKNFTISESPEEVLQLIEAKLSITEIPTLDSKQIIKNKL